jgi:hypothetical protein
MSILMAILMIPVTIVTILHNVIADGAGWVHSLLAGLWPF